MFLSIPPGLALLNISITDSWTDEELVRFLAERKAVDSLPANVLEGVDFSLIDPCGSANIWYINESNDQQPSDNGENAIRMSKNGYWKSVNTTRIPTSTAIVGVKINLEHYEGHPQSGKRTGWVMHEYQVEKNDEANLPQVYKSLCRMVFQGDKKLNAEDPQISLNANAPNDLNESSYLQYLAELDEQKAVFNSQVAAENEQNVSSSNVWDEQKTSAVDDEATSAVYDQATSAVDDQAVRDALDNEDYIEMNDLLSSDGSASTSEYSSRRSIISEEYFDSDAFLREIKNDCKTTSEKHTDSKFSIAAPAKSDRVVICPPEQGLVNSNYNNATLAGTSLEKSTPTGEIDQHPSEECPQHSPASSCFPSSHVKRSRSGSSNSSRGTSNSPQRERSVGKFGKKYCCFGSF